MTLHCRRPSFADMLTRNMPGRDHLHILAFEPFDDGSHRQVRESISRHSRHRWTWLTRPGRAWKWRMRLAAAELIDMAARTGAFDDQVDAIFTTSLLSAADLRAFMPAVIRDRPLILYMHENQLAYPAGVARSSVERDRDAQFGLTNLTSILAADFVLWNSQWNRDSYLDGLEALLRHAPDLQLSNVCDRVVERSDICWPPVEPPPVDARRQAEPPDDADDAVLHNAGPDERDRGAESSSTPLRILWPHRWEHDKGPDLLLEIAKQHTEPLNLRWTLLGQRFRRTPHEMHAFLERFADRIDHAGYIPDRHEYWRRLAACDWVLSTARHEFFGIAVVEAMLAGCLPWLPDALSYPELLPDEARGLSPENPPRDVAAIRAAIKTHLKPALAPNAVARLDAKVEHATSSRPRPAR